MKPSRSLLGPSLLKLVCAALLLGSAAQARNEACDAVSSSTAGTCLARVAAVEGRDPTVRPDATAVVGGTRLALWQPDRRTETGMATPQRAAADAEPAPASSSNEPPLLGLLLAALGVVGFVAHRRGGR